MNNEGRGRIFNSLISSLHSISMLKDFIEFNKSFFKLSSRSVLILKSPASTIWAFLNFNMNFLNRECREENKLSKLTVSFLVGLYKQTITIGRGSLTQATQPSKTSSVERSHKSWSGSTGTGKSDLARVQSVYT